METLTRLSRPEWWHHQCGRGRLHGQCELKNKRHVFWPLSESYFSQSLAFLNYWAQRSDAWCIQLIIIKSPCLHQFFFLFLAQKTYGGPDLACGPRIRHIAKLGFDQMLLEISLQTVQYFLGLLGLGDRGFLGFLTPPAEQNATASCVILLEGQPVEATQRGCMWVSQRGESSACPPHRDNKLRCLPTVSRLLLAREGTTPGEAPLFWHNAVYQSEPHYVRVPLLDRVGVQGVAMLLDQMTAVFHVFFCELFPPQPKTTFMITRQKS